MAITGSTTHNIAAAHLTRTVRPQISMGEQPAEIPWATGKRMVGRIRGKGGIGNKQAQWIAEMGNSRAIAGVRVGNRRARWIEVAEVEIGSGIDNFPIRRADRTKALLAVPRRERAEAQPAPVASADLPAWEVPEAAPEAAAVGGEGRQEIWSGKYT